MAHENLAGIIETIRKYGIDCDLVKSGVLNVATEKHQVPWLHQEAAEQSRAVISWTPTRSATHIDSPLFEGGTWEKDNTVLVHPAKLAWGLRRVCLELGVKIFEHTKGEELTSTDTDIQVRTGAGHISARRVALATNVFPSLLKRHRLHTIPVYDYALMTEPLTATQREAIGWDENMGLADMNNRFHYSRPTIDENGGWRILFGGYDAVYHYGRTIKQHHDRHDGTFRKLAAHFIGTFPQLEGIKFSHAWGGAIDTCSRFFAFFDTSHGGRVAYCAGFTGLGVGATRFGARVMLDLLSGEKTELTELQMVKKKPIALPAGAGGLAGREADDQRPGQSGPERGQARSVPQGHGRPGHGVRLVSTPGFPHLLGGQALRVNRVPMEHRTVAVRSVSRRHSHHRRGGTGHNWQGPSSGSGRWVPDPCTTWRPRKSSSSPPDTAPWSSSPSTATRRTPQTWFRGPSCA